MYQAVILGYLSYLLVIVPAGSFLHVGSKLLDALVQRLALTGAGKKTCDRIVFL